MSTKDEMTVELPGEFTIKRRVPKKTGIAWVFGEFTTALAVIGIGLSIGIGIAIGFRMFERAFPSPSLEETCAKIMPRPE